jgi:glycosyltransferase involved in cell wall biosynthesis
MGADVMIPQISVIIPVYNGATYIPELAEMLKKQTRKDFEVVFVNDGSKDATKEALDSLLQQHPFAMTVIHQENGGVSAARNTGLAAAKGKYICFIDADDEISHDYLQVLYDALESTDSRVAVGNITRDKQDLTNTQAHCLRTYSSTEFLREFLYRGIRFSVCACMFDRACFDGGFCFPVGFRYSEDVFLLWQLFAKEQRITEVMRKIYYYYDNPNSAMNKGIDLKRMDAIRLMQKLEGILAELAPEFSPEFNQFAVARHHWSILWQAAVMLKDYKAFREYAGHFEMKQELKKLLQYPEKRISLSSRLYILCPRLYYHALRLYVKIRK